MTTVEVRWSGGGTLIASGTLKLDVGDAEDLAVHLTGHSLEYIPRDENGWYQIPDGFDGTGIPGEEYSARYVYIRETGE